MSVNSFAKGQATYALPRNKTPVPTNDFNNYRYDE